MAEEVNQIREKEMQRTLHPRVIESMIQEKKRVMGMRVTRIGGMGGKSRRVGRVVSLGMEITKTVVSQGMMKAARKMATGGRMRGMEVTVVMIRRMRMKRTGDEGDGKEEKDEKDEGGQEDGDGLRVEVSHGSVEVFASGGNLTLDPPNMKGESEFVVDGSVVVGFLESGKEYQVAVDDEEITFVTEENPYSWSDTPLVYPGVNFYSSRCTMGFIFQDHVNESVFGMTAAHCVELGENIFVDEELVGKVVVHRHGGNWDLALVEIYNRSVVSPSLPYFSGPTGLAGSVVEWDTLCFYGTARMLYPIGSMSLFDEEGGARCGYKFNVFDNNRYRMTGPGGYAGDSGSPVIHYETGAAFGILQGGLPAMAQYGNIICNSMGWLANEGYDLLLSTYSYDPEPAKPTSESSDDGGVEWCDY